jgi:LacI family transcriptional regulator
MRMFLQTFAPIRAAQSGGNAEHDGIYQIASFHIIAYNRHMVSRPTIVDLAKAAGVSVATVDRVLNRRLPVREDTAQRVVRAAETIGFHATGLLKRRLIELPKRRFGFLLQKRQDFFYHALGDRLGFETTQSRTIQGKPVVDYIDDLAPQKTVDRLRAMAAKVDAVAVVAVDHPLVNDAVEEIARAGKPVFTLISDITAPSRTANLAVDSRKKGRTAAWAIARMARSSGKVGILVGTHGYLSQEIVEMSFRSYFREHAPDFQLLEPDIDLDDNTFAYEGARKLLKEHSDIVGIFSLGGGQDGFIQALRDADMAQALVSVCNELTPTTRAALIDGTIAVALGTPIAAIATRTVEFMSIATDATSGTVPPQLLLPPDIHISETI